MKSQGCIRSASPSAVRSSCMEYHTIVSSGIAPHREPEQIRAYGVFRTLNPQLLVATGESPPRCLIPSAHPRHFQLHKKSLLMVLFSLSLVKTKHFKSLIVVFRLACMAGIVKSSREVVWRGGRKKSVRLCSLSRRWCQPLAAHFSCGCKLRRRNEGQ